MKTKSNKIAFTFSELPKDFLGLVAMFPPHPIADDIDLDNVMEIVDCLVGHKLSKGQDEYLDLVSELVEKYEDEHHAIDVSGLTPLDMLKHLMETHSMTASDLGRLLGERSLGSKILTGGRDLSKAHIRTLANHFHVDASLFL